MGFAEHLRVPMRTYTEQRLCLQSQHGQRQQVAAFTHGTQLRNYTFLPM